jgi:hypothetical protein
MEIVDSSSAIVGIKCTLDLINHFQPEDLPRIFLILKCYQQLTRAQSHAEVEKVKAEFDIWTCRAVWEALKIDEQNRIKEVKKNDKNGIS